MQVAIWTDKETIALIEYVVVVPVTRHNRREDGIEMTRASDLTDLDDAGESLTIIASTTRDPIQPMNGVGLGKGREPFDVCEVSWGYGMTE